jgi:hypothetical protein
MLARACFGLLLLACASAWAQVDATSTEAASDSPEEVQLRVPPPVSGQAFSSEFAGDTESNYLRGGFTFTSTYNSNIYGGGSSNPVGSMSYSIWPTIALDKTTSREHLVLSYSPGFTLYQRTSALNQSNQNVAFDLQYRLSPNLTLNLRDAFYKASNVFNQPNPLLATPVSGSASAQSVAVIAPVADQLNNMASAQLTYQVSEDGMVGATGSFGELYYPNQAQASGLYSLHTDGGSVFYSRQLLDKYYIGGTYQYQNSLSYQAAATGLQAQTQTQTQTQTILLFLSVYLNPNLSLSLSEGPQHYRATQASLPASESWAPMTMVSLGWRGERTTLAASYRRTAGEGGGLNGAFQSNTATASATWQMSRTWSAALSGGYSNYKTLTPLFVQASSGGHTITGTASAQHSLTEHLNVQFGWNWAHQSYRDVAAVSSNPNLNRVFASINYQFTRPLQR